MAEFVLKLKGPQREMELQVPVGSACSTVDTLKNLISEKEHAVSAPSTPEKKHWWNRKKTSTTTQTASKASTTALVLLTSLVLSALDE